MQAGVLAQRFEHLQQEFKGGLTVMKAAMHQQEQQFQKQFEQLLTLSTKQDQHRHQAHREIAGLKDQITQQRKDHQNQLWDYASHSAHFRFDLLKDANPYQRQQQAPAPSYDTSGYGNNSQTIDVNR